MKGKGNAAWDKLINYLNSCENSTITRDEMVRGGGCSPYKAQTTVDTYRTYLIKFGYIKKIKAGHHSKYEITKAIPLVTFAQMKQHHSLTLKQ